MKRSFAGIIFFLCASLAEAGLIEAIEYEFSFVGQGLSDGEPVNKYIEGTGKFVITPTNHKTISFTLTDTVQGLSFDWTGNQKIDPFNIYATYPSGVEWVDGGLGTLSNDDGFISVSLWLSDVPRGYSPLFFLDHHAAGEDFWHFQLDGDPVYYSITANITGKNFIVPEPSTLALFGLGLAFIGWRRRYAHVFDLQCGNNAGKTT